jgi:multidrug resistance efflux pump
MSQSKIAVPYIPPPPPDNSSQKKFRSPLVNGFLIALVILLGGFMAYNFVGHQLTHLASESDSNVSITPSISPTVTPSPTPQY